MRQPWNELPPDGIKQTLPPTPAKKAVKDPPLAIVPLHIAMMALVEFCESRGCNWTLAKRGNGGAAHMICQITTQDGRLMSSAAMFELPKAILQAVAGARAWAEQREAKAA
jgi:hypothetical protein